MNLYSPKDLPPPVGYSHVAKLPGESLVFIAGQVPPDASGALVGEADFAAQGRVGHAPAIEVERHADRLLQAAHQDFAVGDVARGKRQQLVGSGGCPQGFIAIVRTFGDNVEFR